jgi:hypothetical protein
MPVLYLTEQGATLGKDGELFVVTKDEQELARISAIKVAMRMATTPINCACCSRQ